MILAVLIGNSNTRIACFSGRRLVQQHVVPTPQVRRNPQRILKFRQARSLDSPGDSALASVVPALTRPVARALARTLGRPPLIVGTRTKTGLRFNYNRRQLGADRLCAAVGALERYRRNTLVVDFGTAITVNAVTAAGKFLGGAILPGPNLMLRALADNTGRLPRVTPGVRHRATGHNTVTAIRSGVFHLLAGGIARIIDRIRSETGRNWLIVATGGGAPLFRRHIPAVSRFDPELALRGLAALYDINRCGVAPHHNYRRS